MFCNDLDIGHSEFARMTDALQTALAKKSKSEADSDIPSPTGICPISNLVCYLSRNFCVFALNFGRDVTEYDASVLNVFAAQVLFLKSIATQVREVEDAFEYTVLALARAAEANDEDTGNHILRVGKYAALLAEKMDMPCAFVDAIRIQGQMHDVGKLHIPSEILKKSGKLTPGEWEEIKKHPLYGAKILGDHTRLAMATSISLTHHERWDGGGYPGGLKGEQIPIEGRILSIADQYDALRNQRVYKPAFDHEDSVRIITKGDGRTMPCHFDPQVLKVFKETASQFQQIYEELQDERDATAPYPLR